MRELGPWWLGGSRQNTNTFARWEGGEVKIAAHELVRLILGLAWIEGEQNVPLDLNPNTKHLSPYL